MEGINNSINWFEISVLDFERAKLFYSMIYNYEMPEQMMGQLKMGFFLVEKCRFRSLQAKLSRDILPGWFPAIP